MPLRRSERIAIRDSIRFARERSPSSESVDPHASERNRIIGVLTDCRARCCATLETKLLHETSCEWCRTHPEWRLISHNITILMEDMGKLRGKEAKIPGALAVMSYINDNVIDFAKAHEKFKLTTIQKCQEFIADAGDSALLRLVCADVIYKLKA